MTWIRNWAIGVVVGTLMISPPAQAQTKPVVAILDFTNSSLVDRERYDAFSVGLAAMMISELRSNPDIELVERERLHQVLDEVTLGQTESVDQNTAVKVGKVLGAKHLILGAFFIDRKGNLRLDARAVSVETSRIEHVETVVDDADNLLRAVRQLGRQLSQGLKLPGEPARLEQPAAKRGQLLADLKLARAVEAEDRKNAEEAVQLYREYLADTPRDYAPTQRREVEARLERLTGGTDQ